MHDALSVSDFASVPEVAAPRSWSATIDHDLAHLERPWSDLEARADGSVFQSYSWCRAWVEASRRAGCRETPYIVSLWSGDRLVVLLPLVLRHLGPFRILHMLGEPATQYSDALVERGIHREPWITAAWETLTSFRGVDAIMFRGVRADAAMAPLLAECCGGCVTRSEEAPFSDFRPDARNGPVRRRSARTRNTLRRHQRDLAEHGPVAFELVGDAAGRVEAMREALRLKHAWLNRTRRISAGYAHPANRFFLEAIAACPDFLVARLSVGGHTAAVEAGILRQGYYASLVQSYDDRFAEHGPGRLLFWSMVEQAAEIGIEVLDFLAPAYPHKREWANDAMPVSDYVIPLRLWGQGPLAYVRHVRPRMKLWLERLRRLGTA
ncbi:protein involved in cellulose biosynthesis (CelD)-like protein [Methylobacterium nodulans ORS 2060]|uniref:Protein involved in cellulose biosynthesis (CelD)-like protein n=1 Tax=Methylobacterium nodulans (strain LMG 21967 / CNCM I-2342 / ORS 2060) TaxID=460265 RepID=B8IPB2_METNO|nr:protein involved in cellulose biosynthesis (CelD)-like protein [Methylobacterium nodulans ORS 2060]